MLTVKSSRGFSLIEIIVAIAICSIAIFAVISLFSNALLGGSTVVTRGKLDRDMAALMNSLVADIQRSGYYLNSTNTTNNPFMTGTSDVIVGNTSDCITFTYDRNNNATVAPISSAVTDDEHYGFKKTGNAIQYRPSGASFNCNGVTTDWTNLTDPSALVITAFSITKTTVAKRVGAGGTDTTNYRVITISITGNLANSTNSLTLSRDIKVYNNSYTP